MHIRIVSVLLLSQQRTKTIGVIATNKTMREDRDATQGNNNKDGCQ